MAHQVVRDTQADIDWLLVALAREWEHALDIVARWNEADELEQNDLLFEWPIARDYLIALNEYANGGAMSSEQCRRFAELQRFMDEHRSELERILGAEHV